MADTEKLLEALKSGAKRIRLPDGSETEFHSPSENSKAIDKLKAEEASASGRRRRVTRLTFKTGW